MLGYLLHRIFLLECETPLIDFRIVVNTSAGSEDVKIQSNFMYVEYYRIMIKLQVITEFEIKNFKNEYKSGWVLQLISTVKHF
jgi:hypothetical protein